MIKMIKMIEMIHCAINDLNDLIDRKIRDLTLHDMMTFSLPDLYQKSFACKTELLFLFLSPFCVFLMISCRFQSFFPPLAPDLQMSLDPL